MMGEQPATLSKHAGLRAAITAELMIGFWFGVGVMLAVGVADGLNHFVRVSYKRKIRLLPIKWQNKYNK